MNILLATTSEIIRDGSTPQNIMDSGTYNDGAADWWLYLCTEDHSALYPGSKIIGQWDFDGSVAVTATDEDGNPTAWYPIDPDYEAYIRPLGNATVTEFDIDGNPISTLEGVATDSLDYFSWLGNGQRYLQPQPVAATLAEYPDDNQPIILTMEWYFDETPGFEGEAWRATIEFSDPTRAPDARAIGIYDENWNYLYTTGAFIWTEVEPETTDPVTGEIIPAIFKWQTNTPAGRATPTRVPVYYALLWGSIQEGRMTLTDAVQQRVDNYWDRNQDNTQTLSGVDLLYYQGIVLSYQFEGLTYG